MVVTPLSSAAEVLVAADHDPYVRGRLSRTDVEGWAGHGAVAWRFRYTDDRAAYVMTHGAPGDVALLLEALLPEVRDGQEVTVPRGTAALLPAWVGLDGVEWDFRWTTTPPPRQPLEAEVRDATDDEVTGLLVVANPEASARPGDARVRRWVGIRHPSGQLLACAADTTEATGVGHLSSIATHPEYRGRGLATAVTSALIGDLFSEGCDVVTLGLYASNPAGRALYDRLGMLDRGFTSGKLQIRSRW
ncbi:MAG: GNAT family N-acetyltransferase [Actinomycetota bacterium]|nr:GNAT family N-acetyltransferase [Actinomycetota bacterium]